MQSWVRDHKLEMDLLGRYMFGESNSWVKYFLGRVTFCIVTLSHVPLEL
jgi:hypothetical protein